MIIVSKLQQSFIGKITATKHYKLIQTEIDSKESVDFFFKLPECLAFVADETKPQ